MESGVLRRLAFTHWIQASRASGVLTCGKDPDSLNPSFPNAGDVPLSAKGTLLESTAGGPGGGLVPPEYQAGVVATLFAPLVVGDLFAQSQTSASQIRYVVEGTATNAAAGVAEAGVKPESELDLSEVSEPIKKIATVLPVSDELLEDATPVQAYLNSRLSLFRSRRSDSC